ncbi:MAG: hypothetical protein EPO02_02405 [Nitrospirae bacterium]|nr:MAG: hypothetical protein EPO02_02405 [Nitrospirota bacterium]
MRRLALIGALSACLLGGTPLETMADEKTEKALEERIKRLEKLVEDLTKHEVREAKEEGKEKAKETKEGEKSAPYTFSGAGGGKSIYAKPFVSAPKTTVGGYMDLQYRTAKNSSIDNAVSINGSRVGTSSTFDQQRFVPFFYSDVTDRLKVAAELEVEHGVRSKSNTGSGIEVSLEFATIDYLIHEKINFRTGIILLPVGKFNLLHDSPLNDLSDRPLVSTRIIPSTLSEAGAGFYGTFYPTRLSKLDYELYVTNGFNGYNNAGTPVITSGASLRDARQRVSTTDDGLDNNNGKAVVGRLAFSPFLGAEVGASGYYGGYSPVNDRHLSIMAVDWTLQRGPFELIGEAAWAYAKNNSKDLFGNPAEDSTFAGHLLPQRMGGFYVQANYHFMPEALKRWAPSHFKESSTFTGVLRWDDVNTNRDAVGGPGDVQRLTFGLNFRPVEDTVFKLDYQFNFENGRANRINNDALVLSVATYF